MTGLELSVLLPSLEGKGEGSVQAPTVIIAALGTGRT